MGETEFVSRSDYDGFGRKSFDELKLGKGFISRQFSYHAGKVTEAHKNNDKLQSAPVTQLVSQIILSDGRTLNYEYDKEERVTKVIDSIEGTTEYTYDALGQLLSETKNGEVINTMTYDNYGNILTKNGVAYTYGDTVWKDKLTKFDGLDITYDSQGNPLNYLGHNLTWEKGRQLKSFDTNTYTYNANGIRTSKTVDGVRHTFTLDGAKILKETWENNTLVPLYDNADEVCGIIYNGTPYFFIKNLQGDVIAITDDNGETVAKYSYDAWGVCTVESDTNGIANINPYRYRSYYYDAETGMYYLQSRYYNPNVGRFVNGDEATFVGAYGTTLSYTLFSYCENDVITKADYNGQIPLTLQGMYRYSKNVTWNSTLLATYCAALTAYTINNAAHNNYNKKISKSIKGYIYGQSVGNVSKMWFGFFRSSYNGCGWIATYNATKILGKIIEPHKIIKEYELMGAILFGVFGLQPFAISKFFKKRGYKVTLTYNKNKFNDVAKKNTANIIFYLYKWGGHFFALKYQKQLKKYIVYNFHSYDTTSRSYDSLNKALIEGDSIGAMMISIDKK